MAGSARRRDAGRHDGFPSRVAVAIPRSEEKACSSAQPKKSATPIFKRMLTSHQAALQRARGAGEPAGQLAARELEVQRINSALRRAGDLDDDVAAAIEAA